MLLQEENASIKAAIDKTPTEGQAVYKASVDVLKLASCCHEDGLNIDPEVFDSTEAQRQARQVDAIAKLFAKFQYQDVMLNMFSDVPPYLLQEAKQWRSKEVDTKRQKIATDCQTHRQLRNRDKSKARLLLRNFCMGVQTIRAVPGALDATKLRITSMGWQGLNVNRLKEGAAICYLHANAPGKLAILVQDFRRVPYADDFSKAQITIITDCENCTIIARSIVQLWMQQGALAELELDMLKFFRICLIPFTEADMAANARGAHYFSIIGIHRNNLEEAGLIIELPPGVMLAYPYFLFFHWNVDICDLDKVEILLTKDRSKPDLEKGNTVPLTDHEKWDRAHGQGSMVWFNQATLFQSAELDVKTIKAATARHMNTTSDHQSMIKSGYFPEVAGASNASTSGTPSLELATLTPGAPAPEPLARVALPSELSMLGTSAPEPMTSGPPAPGQPASPAAAPELRALHTPEAQEGVQYGEGDGQTVEKQLEEGAVCDMSFSDDDLFEGAGGMSFSEEGEQSDGLGLGMGFMGLSNGSKDVQDMDLSLE
ncbi:hypothetical protein BD413DRAFT_616840 [Trametes elegans]|nr:hypothetical protein BD413DRAFT_616840 [Trametes elegans]